MQYDAQEEERSFARALLTEADLAKLKKELEETGFMSPQDVQKLLEQENRARAEGGAMAFDPEMMLTVDQRTDQCLFVTGDNRVYSREDLMNHHPFEAMGTTPEKIFVQQEVGVFPGRDRSPNSVEFLARPVGSEGEFLMLEDFVAQQMRKGHQQKREPLRVVRTKIFLAGAGWDDFITMSKFARSYRRMVLPQLRDGNPNMLALMFGGGLAAPGNVHALESPDAVRRREQEVAEREQRAAEREAALQLREAHLKELEDVLSLF